MAFPGAKNLTYAQSTSGKTAGIITPGNKRISTQGTMMALTKTLSAARSGKYVAKHFNKAGLAKIKQAQT